MGKRLDATIKNIRLKNDLEKRQEEITTQSDNNFSPSTKNPFNNPPRDNYRTYKYDYFCGADCKIFFGDIWVDDIATIQYNVNQSKTPIYGYASQNFDAIARGQVIVQGNLTVQFKETGYLNIIQSVIESQKRNAVPSVYHKVREVHAKADIGIAKFDPRLTTIGEGTEKYGVSYSPNGTPQVIRQEETIEDILANKNASRAVSRNLNLGNDSNKDFEDFAEVLEDTIWGDSNGEPLGIDTNIKRADEFDYNRVGGIDVASNDSYATVLNILLTFGDINDFRAEHSMTVLNDVHFLSTSVIISQTGEPIGETYSFIARDINKSFSKETLTNMDPVKLDVGVDDVTLTKLENISNAEEYLENQKNNQDLVLNSIASLDDYGWSNDTSINDIKIDFTAVRSEPLIDQLIKVTEEYMNSITHTNDTGVVQSPVDPSKIQYMVSIEGSHISENQKINMILEQSVPGTRSYKVISPARTGFRATNIIGRDELLRADLPNIDDQIQAELQKRDRQLQQEVESTKKEVDELQSQIENLGLSDKDRQKMMEKVKFLNEAADMREEELLKDQMETSDRISVSADGLGTSTSYNFHANEESDYVMNELAKEKASIYEKLTTVDDRDLSLDERIKLRRLTREYERKSDELNDYIDDSKNLNETIRENDERIRNNQNSQTSSTEKKQTESRNEIIKENGEIKPKDSDELPTETDERIQSDALNEITNPYATDPNKQINIIETELSPPKKYNQRIQRFTTAKTGEAITLLPEGHTSDYYSGRGSYSDQDFSGTLAMDVGNIIEKNNRLQTAGYITCRSPGRVYAKGKTTLYIEDFSGRKYSMHHLDENYVQKINEGHMINQGDKIRYSNNHVHFQSESSDWDRRDFVWSLGTNKVRNVSSEAYKEYF